MMKNDFSQYVGQNYVYGGLLPNETRLITNNKLTIRDGRVHNGNEQDAASFYGIGAILTPKYAKGVIYQIVISSMSLQSDDLNKTRYTENEQYIEAWPIYHKKPIVIDYIMNERYSRVSRLYNSGYRYCSMTTWFKENHNSNTLKRLGFTKGFKTGANGLYEHLDVGIIIPPIIALERIIHFEWSQKKDSVTIVSVMNDNPK
jgi:hypothetical protein